MNEYYEQPAPAASEPENLPSQDQPQTRPPEKRAAARNLSPDALAILEELKAEMLRLSSPWLTRTEAAIYCSCSVRTIHDAAESGAITRYRVGSDPRFKRSDLDRWIEGRNNKTKDPKGSPVKPKEKEKNKPFYADAA